MAGFLITPRHWAIRAKSFSPSSLAIACWGWWPLFPAQQDRWPLVSHARLQIHPSRMKLVKSKQVMWFLWAISQIPSSVVSRSHTHVWFPTLRKFLPTFDFFSILHFLLFHLFCQSFKWEAFGTRFILHYETFPHSLIQLSSKLVAPGWLITSL